MTEIHFHCIACAFLSRIDLNRSSIYSDLLHSIALRQRSTIVEFLVAEGSDFDIITDNL